MQVRKKFMRIAAAILAVTVLCGSCERQPDTEQEEEPSAPPPFEPVSADVDTDVSCVNIIKHDEKTEIWNSRGELFCVISYEMPVIKYGEGMEERQAAADRINSYFEHEKESFLSSPYVDSLVDIAEDYLLRDVAAIPLFSAKVSTEVVYDKDNILSFRQLEHWFIGGPNQDYEYGLTFNSETGEKLLVSDFISLPLEDFTSKLVDYLNQNQNSYSEDQIKEEYVYSSYEEYQFFVVEDTLYVILPAYTTADVDYIIGWSLEKQEPVQFLYGRQGQFDSNGIFRVG